MVAQWCLNIQLVLLWGKMEVKIWLQNDISADADSTWIKPFPSFYVYKVCPGIKLSSESFLK